MISTNRRSSFDLILFGEPEKLFEELDSFAVSESAMTAPLLSFRENLASALRVALIPYQLVSLSVLEGRYTQLLTAERIRNLTGDFSHLSEDEKENRARNSAKKEDYFGIIRR